tara:strand:- start:737 stop:2506 length:1770 start_codon:yes stop_codon:yes gene_type:complete
MGSWKKILVSNTSGDTSANTGLLNGQITPSDLAVKWDTESSDFSVVDGDVNSGTGYSAGVASQVLTINPSDASQLVWKDATTTFTDLTDTSGNLTDGNIVVADGTDLNLVSQSGDVTVSNTGKFSITAGAIVNADVNSNAAIADTKLGTISTANKVSGSAVQLAGTSALEDSSGLQLKSALGGTGLTLTNQVLSVDSAQSQISSLGTLTALNVDNINIDANTISSTNSNGDINITPTGTGTVVLSKVDVASGEIDGVSIGANSPSTGAFTTLDSSGNVQIGTNSASTIKLGHTSNDNAVITAFGSLGVTGNLDVDGTVDLAAGALKIENSSASTLDNFFVFPAGNITWDGAGTTIDIDIRNMTGSTAVVPAGSYWLESSQEDLFVKVSLSSDSNSFGSSANSTITFTIEDWPQYDNGGTDEYVDILADASEAHKIYTQSPAGDIHVTFGDNVIFYGGGVMTSTSNFASTDNIIHLNVVDSNSDGTFDGYASTQDTGIVFGTSAADGAANGKKGGKILNTEHCFVFSGLLDDATVAPSNQDTNGYTALKEVQSKAITFNDNYDFADGDTTGPASGDTAIASVGGVLMAWV